MVPTRKLWVLFRRYVAISMASESEFRQDFFASIVQLLLYAASMIIFWDAVLRLTGPIAGWGLADVTMITALDMVSSVVAGLLFGMGGLPERILRGEVDRYLTKPAPPFLCLAWERMMIPRHIQVLISGMIIATIAVWQMGFRTDLQGALLALLLTLMGRTIMILLNASLATTSFWLGKVDAILEVVNQIHRFEPFPVIMFDRPLRLFLTWVWPFGLYLTYPVLLMRGEVEQVWPLMGGAAVLLLAWALLLRALLVAGLRRYESFGG